MILGFSNHSILTLRVFQRPVFPFFCLCFFLINGLAQLAIVAGDMGNRSPRQSAQTESVGCKCSCCGDRCPMGKKCCCNTTKSPSRTPISLFFAPLTCHPGEGGSGDTLSFLSYRFLQLADFQLIAFHCSESVILFPIKQLQTIYTAPDTPPPKIFA